MKVVKNLLIMLFLIMLFLPIKAEASDNKVNMYLFYSKTCLHCQALEEALVDIKDDYPNLQIYKYEISQSIKNNKLMEKAATELGTSANYVPFTIIGTRFFEGYSGTQTKSEIEYALKLYSSVISYKDPIGELLEVDYSKGALTYEDIKKAYEQEGKADTPEGKIIDVPFIGPIATKALSLPLVSILIGAVDGFNPCAMWVLLFLLSVLIGMKDRKRMWILGCTFIVSSAFIYLFFMLVWLNLNILISTTWWKMLIAAIAFIGGYINLKTFFKAKEDGCEVVDETKRRKIFSRIKQFTNEQNFSLALLGIIALAVSVNFIELSCSAGLPAIFTDILARNQLSMFDYSFYMFLYIFFFMLDDLIVFFIAMKSLKLTGISNKYSKYSHLVGGIIMTLIGLLMILKPEWLMFNF